MEAFFNTLLVSTLCLSVYYIGYFLFLRKEKRFMHLRAYLLISILMASILPFSKFRFDIQIPEREKVFTERILEFNTQTEDVADLRRMSPTKNINDRLYSVQTEEYGDVKVKTWNEFLAEINHGRVDTAFQREEIERIESVIEEAIADGAVLTEEDIDNIKDSVGIDLQIEKEKTAVSTMTLDERYAKGKFDGNNIIEVFLLLVNEP